MEASDWLQAPKDLHPRTDPAVSTEEVLEPILKQWNGEKFSPWQGTTPHFLGSLVCSVLSTPTELSRPLHSTVKRT